MAENILKILITGDAADLDKELSSVDKKLQKLGDSTKKIGERLSLSLTAPLLLAGTAAVKLASDFDESMNKVQVAFKGSSKEVIAFSKTTLKSFGIAQGTALDMAAQFGDMSTSMGLSTGQASKLSTGLVGLAGDLASFKNMNIKEVTTALNGVFTGETESLKRLGVVMTENNLKHFAMSQGIKGNIKDLDESQKVLLRYNYVMAKTANAHGDFERTGGGAANQMRMFGESMKELGVSFGQVILPAVTSIIKALNGMLLKMNELSPATKTFLLIAGGIAALAGPMLYIAGSVMPKMVTGYKMMTAAASKFNLTLKAAGGVTALAAMMGYAVKAAVDYSSAQVDLVKNNKEVVATENDAVDSIYEKNKAIYAQIAAIDKQISQQKGIKPGQFGQAIVVSESQLKESKNKLVAQLKQNRAILQKASATSAKETSIGGVDLTPKGTTGAGKAGKEQFGLAGDIQSLADKIADARKETLALKNEFLNLRWPSLGDPLKALNFDTEKITEKIKTPFQIMNQQIAANTKVQQEELTMLQDSYKTYMGNAQVLADGLGQMFSNLGAGLIDSLGLAKDGIEGIIAAMAKMLLQLGIGLLQEAIINKAKQAFLRKTAMTNAIVAGSSAAASMGPAGVVALPGLIAGAMGTVGAALAGVQAFAQGGIVSGPTMGLVGEYPGAKSNPEVIAPLNKLQGMLDQGNQSTVLGGEFKVRGQDLLLVMQRAEKERNRIG
jgi:hypothetical protein